jgi:cytochrome c551
MNISKYLLLFIFLALSFSACREKEQETADGTQPTELSHREEMRLKQYIYQGRRLYLQHCANCHQDDGTGLGRLIPPLKDADYMMESIERTVCIIKNGLEGEITVNGVQYNQPMPANKQLTNIEVAEIVTFLHNTWGNHRGTIGVKTVEKIQCD